MATDEFESALRHCTLNSPATEKRIIALENVIGVPLPQAYRNLLLRSNGLEGFVGTHSYLVLWPVEQIAELNDAYVVSEFAPGLLLIGTDGGDTGYAIDTRTKGLPFVEVPLVGMSLEEVNTRGSTFADFLQKLRQE